MSMPSTRWNDPEEQRGLSAEEQAQFDHHFAEARAKEKLGRELAEAGHFNASLRTNELAHDHWQAAAALAELRKSAPKKPPSKLLAWLVPARWLSFWKLKGAPKP